MRRSKLFHRTVAMALSLSAVAWLCAVPWPHPQIDTDELAITDSDDSYRTCQLFEVLPAAPPLLHLLQLESILVQFQRLCYTYTPRTLLVVLATTPRAPPTRS